MEHIHTAKPHSSLLAGMMSAYAEARTEHFRRQIFSKTVRELEKLTDGQLKDIGIPRDQIKQRAYQSVYNHQPYSHATT